MIKPLSAQKTYTLIYSGDPALNRPAPLADDATAETKEAHAALVEDFDRRFKVAQETSDWREMIIPGKQPVMFQMRQVKASQFGWCQGTIRRNKLGDLESTEILFRLALSQVDGLDGAHFKERVAMDGQMLAPVDAYDAVVDAFGFPAAAELANVVFARCTEPLRPL